MIVRIRPFAASDYPNLARVGTSAAPDDPLDAGELRYRDDRLDRDRVHLSRVVAEDAAGRVVGWGQAGHVTDERHPDRYRVDARVDPAFGRRGVGSALLADLAATLRSRGAELRRAETKPSRPGGVPFLGRHGFRELRRARGARLDLTAFDPTAFPDPAARLAGADVELTTFAEERATHPGALAGAFALFAACARDQPSPDPETDLAAAAWGAESVAAPWASAEANWLAKEGGRLVGKCVLMRRAAEPGARAHDLTGVLPEWRGRGIASALKPRAPAWAKARGGTTVRTRNDASSAPTIAINDRIGFVRAGPWLIFEADLRP